MFSKILIANRGAIAVRIQRSLKKMGIKSAAVYARADRDSLHVENADEALYLGDGNVKETYLNASLVLDAAIKCGADAIHPGYGFLSENTGFARDCESRGIKFIGPLPEQVEMFGLKHRARELAMAAGVPLLPGSGLLYTAREALAAVDEIGYPIMLKSTAGGGGIGIRICESGSDLKEAYAHVRRLAGSNFGDDGVFAEKYIERARHIEVQIFGNEYGEAVALGERDCSVQRRNQKVLEEAPAPGISDELRSNMMIAAERLAKSVGYRSAGTVEFLYDDRSGEFYFLEVNTRLQVEHGITEEVCGIDLVEWMVLEAAGELKNLSASQRSGHSMEARIYAEDCLNNFRPGTGKIDDVVFAAGVRTETWIRKNIEISPFYDPMLAKLIVRGETREEALNNLRRALADTKIFGVPTNLNYLLKLTEQEQYASGLLYTKMLDSFCPEEAAIEVLDGGLQTTVQDYPGMLGYWMVGVPPCGAFDSLSFRIGNRLLGNDEGLPGLEITMRGGSYKFRTAASFCLTGADTNAQLDGEAVFPYAVTQARAGQSLVFGESSLGMRTYLLVAGGIQVPRIMGSGSTFIDGKFGGHNGRPLRTGDVLNLCDRPTAPDAVFPPEYRPKLTNEWVIGVIPGPQPTDEYLKPEYLETLKSSEYEVNFNSARTGIRLNGPVPQWVREDGGEAGLHPSNIHDNAYAIGALDLTGDQSILLGPDGPSLGGFVCPVTAAKSELWKMGQLRPGDKVRFRLISLEDAAAMRYRQECNINSAGACSDSLCPVPPEPVRLTSKPLSFGINDGCAEPAGSVSTRYAGACSDSAPPQLAQLGSEDPSSAKLSADYAILARGSAGETDYIIRLCGEENVLIEFGEMELNIELRFRVHTLMEALSKTDLPIIDMTPGIRSLQVHFDCDRTNAKQVTTVVEKENLAIADMDDISVPSRIFHLPLSWDDPQTRLAAKRYQQTVRPDAPWCPSNPEFIRRINGLDSIDDLKRIFFDASYLVLGLGDVYLGAPVAAPVDPRHRLVTTKYNPARPWTPENAVGIGGAYLCVYGMEGPGGYQFVGRTIQMWNPLMETEYFKEGKPWLLNFFDQLRFYPCTAEEILAYRDDFLRGRFKLNIEESTFNLGEYKRYLADIHESTAAFKVRQEAAFQGERRRWAEQGLDQFVSETDVSVHEPTTVPEGCISIPAPIPGSVWKITAELGQNVRKGDTIAILESMKTEFEVTSPVDGVVRQIDIVEGQQVNAGQQSICIRALGA